METLAAPGLPCPEEQAVQRLQKLSGAAAYSKGQRGQSKHRTTSIISLGIKKQGITTDRLLAGFSKAREG